MKDNRSRILPFPIPDSVRRALYTGAGPVVTLLAANGVLQGDHVAVWTSLVLAVVTLSIAVVNCETTWRNAVYVATGALQAVLQIYGIGSDATWASVTGVVVSLLGIGLAAAFTPSGQSERTTAAEPDGDSGQSGRHQRSSVPVALVQAPPPDEFRRPMPRGRILVLVDTR